MNKVEKDTALSKAVAITKRRASEGRKCPPFLARSVSFFRGGPPAKYRGRQGKSFFPYNSQPYQKEISVEEDGSLTPTGKSEVCLP